MAHSRLELFEADLSKPESWIPAAQGIDHIIHVATPLPLKPPKRRDELIAPAVDGTLSVLKAASREERIKSIVITSSASLFM